MSVIQDALKKAQRQREQKKSVTPYDNSVPAKGSNALMYVAVGALCCTVVIVLVVVFSSAPKHGSPIKISKVVEAPVVVPSPVMKPTPVPSAASSVSMDKPKTGNKKKLDNEVVTGVTRARRTVKVPATAQTEPLSEPSGKLNVPANVVNTDNIYNEALEQQRAGRLSQARSLYLKVLSVQPNHVESLNNLGIIAGQSGDSREAISYFRKALEYNKNYSKAYNNIGLMSMKEGNRQLAEEYFSKAISLQPGDAEPYVNLSALFKSENKLAEAERILRDAMSKRVEDPSITLSYAVIKDSLGDYEEAALYYRRYLSSVRNPASMKNIVERLQYLEQSKTIK